MLSRLVSLSTANAMEPLTALRALVEEIEVEEREEWGFALLRACRCWHCRRTLADLLTDSEERNERAWTHLAGCGWSCCLAVAPALKRRAA